MRTHRKHARFALFLLGLHFTGSCYTESDSGGPDSPEVASTAQALVSGERPLLIIFYTEFDGEPLLQSDELYHSALFGDDLPLGEASSVRNVRDYFQWVSQGQFTYRNAGQVSVVDDRSAATNAGAEVKANDTFTDQKRKRARYLAGKAGFDFAAFDRDRNGEVSSEELTILVIENPKDSDSGGQTGEPQPCTAAGRVRVCSAVSLVGHDSTLMNFAHELTHTLKPRSNDLYGFHDMMHGCLNQGATLMSCTAGGPFIDQSGVYLDPYHRSRYGWAGMAQSWNGITVATRTIEVDAVDNPWGHLELLTLRNEMNGDAITFEFRGTYSDYDDHVEGLLVWYSKLGENNQVLEIPSLVDPNRTDGSVFVLGPLAGCVLDPNDVNSRGRVRTLGEGRYSMRWSDGFVTTFNVAKKVYGPNDFTWLVSWDTFDGNPNTCTL